MGRTYKEVIELLEKSIQDHSLTGMKDAMKFIESTLYSRIGYAAPLYYAAECDFAIGVDYLLRTYYHEPVLRPDERDKLWQIGLFNYPKNANTIVQVLLENDRLPSRSFLASLNTEISEKLKLAMNNTQDHLDDSGENVNE